MAHICDHFPCHDNLENEFNCEYCYCPLYNYDCLKYGGQPTFLNEKTETIKDCSKCLVPHGSDFQIILHNIKNDRYYSE